MFGILIAVPWLLSAALVILLLYNHSAQSARLRQALGRLENTDKEKLVLQKQLEQLEKNLADMVRGRLPDDLHPLYFDRVIDLKDGLTKNIIFTAIRKDQTREYEYRLVVENTRQKKVWPDVRILVFDQLGIQVGTADIATTPEWKTLTSEGLDAGESRSFSGVVSLQLERPPAYFIIQENVKTESGF